LPKELDLERQQADRENEISRVMTWLDEHYRKQVEKAIEKDYFGKIPLGPRARLGNLPKEMLDIVHINAMEWLLAEGTMKIRRKRVRFMDLILGEGGPTLDAFLRDYLEKMAGQSMSLYEVDETTPGEGIWLVDTLSPEWERIWVEERAASRTFQPGEAFATRIVPTEPKVMSGSSYFFYRTEYLQLRGEILKGPKDENERVESSWVSTCIIKNWLLQLVAPSKPEIVDASGEPVMLTTIHYRVKDWKLFKKALHNQPDVVGDEEDGWARLENPGSEASRVLCAVNRLKENHIELFAPTQSSAEKGKRWLEKITEGTIEMISGSETDPTRDLGDTKKIEAEGPAPDFLADLTEQEKSDLYDRIYHKMYENWADELIPALGGRTPRQAVKTAKGKREVIELLRSYELGELEHAQMERRSPTGLAFLWEELGLRRDKNFP
jgi:hypothetical protein